MYDPERSIIVTGHLDTVGITDLSAEGIFTVLKETLEHSFSDLLSFTFDTCTTVV